MISREASVFTFKVQAYSHFERQKNAGGQLDNTLTSLTYSNMSGFPRSSQSQKNTVHSQIWFSTLQRLEMTFRPLYTVCPLKHVKLLQ